MIQGFRRKRLHPRTMFALYGAHFVLTHYSSMPRSALTLFFEQRAELVSKCELVDDLEAHANTPVVDVVVMMLVLVVRHASARDEPRC